MFSASVIKLNDRRSGFRNQRSDLGLRPNNSFKPTPLRGVVVASSHSPLSASAASRAARLNSGVSAQSDRYQQMRSGIWFAAHLIDSLSDLCVIGGYAFRPGSGTTQNSCASTLVSHSRRRPLLRGSNAKPSTSRAGFCALTIRSSRVRFAASVPAAMIGPPPWPQSGPA